MTEQTTPQPAEVTKVKKIHKHGNNNAVYGLGFIGAVIYYITTATSFLGGVIGVLKAIVWPAFLVYEWMKYLGM
jgi:hypothetical protein